MKEFKMQNKTKAIASNTNVEKAKESEIARQTNVKRTEERERIENMSGEKLKKCENAKSVNIAKAKESEIAGQTNVEKTKESEIARQTEAKVKPKLLLHSCCGPCSTQVIDFLKNDYDITIYYYNPNIDTDEEFSHRLAEQKRYCEIVGVEVLEDGYNPDEFTCAVKGFENEKEGGARCPICFALRLSKTAKKAKALGYDKFGTTLSVSPHKNAEVINDVGFFIGTCEGIEFLEGNYKKQDGYKKSIELSKKYNLYRQNYCGCKFSKRVD